jgi:hypothetical protein
MKFLGHAIQCVTKYICLKLTTLLSFQVIKPKVYNQRQVEAMIKQRLNHQAPLTGKTILLVEKYNSALVGQYGTLIDMHDVTVTESIEAISLILHEKKVNTLIISYDSLECSVQHLFKVLAKVSTDIDLFLITRRITESFVSLPLIAQYLGCTREFRILTIEALLSNLGGLVLTPSATFLEDNVAWGESTNG